MDLGIKSKVAIVTGGNRGIGKAIVWALAREGCRVGFMARDQNELGLTREALKSAGHECYTLTGDVTTPHQVDTFVRAVAQHLMGPIEIVVNNAGGGPYVSVEGSDEEWDKAFNLNLMAAIRISRLVLPEMRDQKWGRIINISSVWGRETGGAMSYNASKAALISLTRNLAWQEAKNGITVNCVCPGSIMFPGGGWDRGADKGAKERGISREAWIEDFVAHNLPGGRFGTPEEVANTVLYLASQQASWHVGSVITVDGGQSHTQI